MGHSRFPETMLVVVALSLVVLLRVVMVLVEIRRNRSGRVAAIGSEKASTLAVLGSGGHTAELLRLVRTLDSDRYAPLAYVVADSDTTSAQRVQAGSKMIRVPRSRHVGQSYASSIPTTLWAILHSVKIVLQIRPDVLLCNGPGTCLPVAIGVLLARIMGLCPGRIIFVESLCRVKTLSLTGRLLYPIADMFVVHWPQLQKKYPNTSIISTFVSEQPLNGTTTVENKDD